MKTVMEMSDRELKKLFQQLHETINVTECFGVSDMILYTGVARELGRRGFEIVDGTPRFVRV